MEKRVRGLSEILGRDPSTFKLNLGLFNNPSLKRDVKKKKK